jgi:hypothetical protein
MASGPGIGSDVTADPAVAAYENPSFQAPSLTKTLGDTLKNPWVQLGAGVAPLALTMMRGEVRANGIDDDRLLANEQMPRAVKRQAALLPGRLGRHEALFRRVTASQIASASTASFLCRLT